MAWEEHFGGCAPVLSNVLGEGRDDGECRFEGGDEVSGVVLVESEELWVGGSREIDYMELVLAGT